MLCDVHCRTVPNRCCRALCYRCNMVLATPGSGCIFSYFRETTMFTDILQISHSLCLAHLPQGLHDPAVEQPLFNSIASTCRDVEGSRRLYLDQREQVGMFLKVRATCRFSLYYCSSWYHLFPSVPQAGATTARGSRLCLQDMQSCVAKARLDLPGSWRTLMTFDPGVPYLKKQSLRCCRALICIRSIEKNLCPTY
jgi:hypothetical protein